MSDQEYAATDIAEDEQGRIFLQRYGEYVVERFYASESKPSAEEADSILTILPWHWVEMSIMCESPIERALLAHLIFEHDGYELFRTAMYPFDDTHIVTTIEPQGEIGNFRADFLIIVRLRHLVTRIVIECDGHDFHERTKQQAARDRARDRFMTTAGVKILRYTGSEIYRDARKCAQEIGEFVQSERYALEKLLPDWERPR